MQTRSQSRMQAYTATTTTTPPKKTKHNNNKVDTPTAPVKHTYRTRSISNNQTLDTVKQNLNQVFDAEFFDDSSAEWNRNKIKMGCGMYSYRTRSTSRK